MRPPLTCGLALCFLTFVPLAGRHPYLAHAAGQTPGQYQAIYTFKGQPDGAWPMAGLAADGQGRLYGTTRVGGLNNEGTVFRLTQPASGAGPWTEEILHSFGPLPDLSDGCIPLAPVTLGSDGSVYGTAQCGPYDTTVVFKLLNAPGWPETLLHAFSPDSNDDAVTGVVFGPDGLLHGNSSTGPNGGASFYVSPLGDQVAFGYDHQFGHSGDGRNPIDLANVPSSYFPGLIGATVKGGASGLGTVYALQPPAGGGSGAFETVLGSFGPAPDVNTPYSPPIAGTGAIRKGIYGCASSGGTHNAGGIYALLPNGNFGLTESVIYSFFTHVPDGVGSTQFLACTLEQASSTGLLVGTTRTGGALGGGTFFQLTPPTVPGGSWTEQVDISFDPASPAGSAPLGVPLKLGNHYFGSMSGSPGNNYGTIYQLTP